MTDPLKALLAPGSLESTIFPPESRYHGLPTNTLIRPDGSRVTYLQRRFVPPSDRFALLFEHAVEQGDRIDNLSAQYLGDPEQFWRICDANDAIRPAELTESVGRRLRITLPEGIPGTPDA